jgi:hypothetical protein
VITKRNFIYRHIGWVALAGVLALGAPRAFGQDEGSQSQGTAQKPQPSEKISELYQKLKPLQDAKNWAAMLDLVSNTLSAVPPTSYDAALLLDMQARLLLQTDPDHLGKAIGPWEQGLKLSDQFGYYDLRQSLEIMKFLAQVIFMQAQEIKDKDQQIRMINDAGGYLKRFIAKTPKPDSDAESLYAQILFYQATADPNHVNNALLDEARKVVEQGMLSTIHPKEVSYRLLLAILQTQNDFQRCSELMELMLSEYPNKKDMWAGLFSTYVNLAANAKIEKQRREYYVRAINTVERAQALGFMNTPRDNYNLFTLYANAGEIGIATDMLYNGMKKGTIESNVTNWKNLGLYYQQSNKELQAISALEEAAKLFPTEGSLDAVIGQIYQGMEKPKQARDFYERAIKKGNLGDKPHQTYLYLAYADVELGDYDAAQAAIDKASATPDGAKDQQVKTLKEGIKQMIEDRERIKAAAAASAKKT